MITRKEFEAWAIRRGYTIDAHGNCKKQIGAELFRFKINKLSVRREVQVVIDHGGNGADQKIWVRLSTGFFSGLSITANDKIAGFRRD